MKLKNIFIVKFFDELLLYSGQYALFYILLNFSKSGIFYFQNLGHTLLILILIIQTILLTLYGKKPYFRFLGSLIAPLFYTAIEIREGLSFVLNMGHIFFWIFSVFIGLMQAFYLKIKRVKPKLFLEFLITFSNVLIFLFLYFYFDLSLNYSEKLAKNEITVEQYEKEVEISNFFDGLFDFVKDSAHVYIILGGVILSLSISAGRIKIIGLKEKISSLFGTYIDNDIRDKIINGDKILSENKNVSILFSDIRSFTSVSENYSSNEITKMLNLYFSEWDIIVSKYHGVIDKFIGDAIMVVFGLNNEESTIDKSILCAIEMIENLPDIKNKLSKMNLPVFKDIGIGINYGEVIAGDIGSEKRKNYTIIGDNVNIASRLESLCKNYSQKLIISENTYKRIKDDNLKKRFKFLGRTTLKGKAEEINVYCYIVKIDNGLELNIYKV